VRQPAKSVTTSEVDQIARRGQTNYDSRLKSILEPSQDGPLVAIDVETGDYAVAADALEASDRLRERHPSVVSYLVRVGSKAAYRLG
jgi:hypothetical protein